MSQSSKDVRIDPFLHGKEKFKDIEKEDEDVSTTNGTNKSSRIDIIGQNGNTGEHYDNEGC